MLMQALDFLELQRRHGCALQMGGSDQWGNIVNGVELIRRMDGSRRSALTTPLLTTASGAEDGQDAPAAPSGSTPTLRALRLLAVLAQHRGRRRRALPEAVHRPAAGRDRPAGGAARRRDQRGQEGAGQRGHRAAARRRGRGSRGRRGPGGVRGRGRRRTTCRRRELRRGALVGRDAGGRAAAGGRAGRLARRGAAAGAAAGRGSTTPGSRTNHAGRRRSLRDGAIKLSAGKKRHVLVRPA